MVQLLIDRGANVNVTDGVYMPLDSCTCICYNTVNDVRVSFKCRITLCTAFMIQCTSRVSQSV